MHALFQCNYNIELQTELSERNRAALCIVYERFTHQKWHLYLWHPWSGYNYESISIRLRFDRRSTPIRLQFDRATTILRYGLYLFWAAALRPK